MNKLLIFGGFFLLMGMSYSSDTKVFVCISPNSKIFHIDENCPALKRCKHDVIEVSKTVAIGEYHRVLCGDE